MAINMYLSIITLNVNALNAPIKRHRVDEWIKKTRSTYLLSSRDPPQNERYTKTESKRMKNDI